MTPITPGRRPRMNPNAVANTAHTPVPTAPTPDVATTAHAPRTAYWTDDFTITKPAPGRTILLYPRTTNANAAGLVTSGLPAPLLTVGEGAPNIEYENGSALVLPPIGANWNRAVWLSDILESNTIRIPGEYVTWVFGHLLKICAYMHDNQITNNRIVPQAIAVNQHDHILLLCDWRSGTHPRNGAPLSATWTPSALEALELDAPMFHVPHRFSPELDVAGLVGILQAFIAKTDGNDTVWLTRQLSVLRSARRKDRPISEHFVANWYTSATAAYGPRRRFNYIVDVDSTCFLAGT